MRRVPRWRRASALALAELLSCPPAVLANPDGGVVQSGAATISGVGTAVVDVHQATQQTTISWESFNVQKGETTNFHQPGADAVAVNRILDQNASQILGAVNANGHVYLINPNGILFGREAQVNVNALIAATGAKADALDNGFDPSADSAPGARVENHGVIRAGDGGFVYLVAPHVENGKDGVIVAPGGEVTLAAGATVYLADRPDGRGVAIRYVAPGVEGESTTRLRDVLAQGALSQLRTGLVKQSGRVEANAVRSRNGSIELYATGEIELADDSVTEARGDDGTPSAGGNVVVYASNETRIAEHARVDVSGGSQGGDGGFIELSAARHVEIGGDLRADAQAGSTGGRILVDPAQATFNGTTALTAALVDVWATDRVSVRGNVNLNGGTTRPYDQRLSLRSGGDVSFESGATISDDGASGSASGKRWDVDIVAGAIQPDDPSRDDAKAWSATAQNGGVYLGGSTYDTSGRRIGVGSAAGEVRVQAGTLKIRAQGDLVIGTGGGLRNTVGDIDVEVGGDVQFQSSTIAASNTTQQLATDAVIENGSGSIRVVAGGSVLLGSDPTRKTNAAIRTRGVASTYTGTDPATGNPVAFTQRTNGGALLVHALGLHAGTGDVDAGIGNRWLQPPRNVNLLFDPLFVVSNGILGIGSEAGGDLTVIAARDVLSGNSTLSRSGGTLDTRPASTPAGAVPATEYNGGHIGLFGGEYEFVTSNRNQTRALENTPRSRLTIVSGRDLSADTVVRQGSAILRAGYALKAGEAVESIASGNVDTRLVTDAAALVDPSIGWLGPLSKPITIDLMDGSLDGRGRNGVAIRAIESPALAYLPSRVDQQTANLRAPGYTEWDSAFLEAETGDVVLVGNDITLPRQVADTGSTGTPQTRNEANILVRLLPPSLTVKTNDFTRGLEQRGGDFVLVNDFRLFPSSQGGLTLDVAGTVRTANVTASSTPATVRLTSSSTGAAADAPLVLSGPIELRDPETGIVYTAGSIEINARAPATAAEGFVLVRAQLGVTEPIEIPAGTRLLGDNGQLYEVTTTTSVPNQANPRSIGEATIEVAQAPAADVSIPTDGSVEFVAPDGSVFRLAEPVTIRAGETIARASIERVPVAGEPLPAEVPRFGLTLRQVEAIPGVSIVRATNYRNTQASTSQLETQVPVRAMEPGSVGSIQRNELRSFVTSIAGIELVQNTQPLSGSDPAPAGVERAATSATASVAGPAGALALNHRLEFVDPSVLPMGVRPEDITIVATGASGGALTPSVFRSLQVTRDANGQVMSTSVDAPADEVVIVAGQEVWSRDAANVAGTIAELRQSDADPNFDGRGNIPFDYASYYARCHSGVACGSQDTTPGLNDPRTNRTVRSGSGPTHAADFTPADLFASGGFDRIRIQTAEPAILFTRGSINDLQLVTQHSRSTDLTQVLVPTGDAFFGARSRTLADTQGGVTRLVTLPGDANAGVEVSGPGRVDVQVGVVPFAIADTDGNGFLSRDEFFGTDAEFDALDIEPAGFPDHRLAPGELPFAPTGRGGALAFAGAGDTSAFGIKTTGNFRNAGLSVGGATLSVAAASDISLGGRGAIGTIQGGNVSVRSALGDIRGESAAEGFAGQRGVFSLFAAPGQGFGFREADASGGGEIDLRALGDIDVGGLAIVALSGSSITLESIGGSIDGGIAVPFANAGVSPNPGTGVAEARFEGGGIAAPGGSVSVIAKRDVRIGAGILAGSSVNVDAGGSVVAGQGSITSGGSVSVSAGGSISGNISAAGNVSLSGSSAGGATVSSGGIATGTGGAQSASTQSGTQLAAGDDEQGHGAGGGAGMGVGSGSGTGKRATRIDVSSRACTAAEIASGRCSR